ncbi:MAG TPA: hypothetical protein VFO03_13050 [Gaiellaceae bacterium]|nr:hypothetical protein [Gaiellaceae bacterium]
MRRLILLASLALAVGVLLPASALPAVGGSDLPIKGTGTGTTTLNLATGEAHLVTTGSLSHFGLVTWEQHGLVLPTGPGTFSFNTTWTVTAANGDQMFGTFSGTGILAADGIHSTWSVNGVSTGGTGRFADASLTLAATVAATRTSVEGTIVSSTHVAEVVGQLSYR